jgi:hypothetical protein
VASHKSVAEKYEAKLWQKLVTTITLCQMGHTENKILQAKVWQKPNTCQLNCGSQTLAWQNVAMNQTA